MKCNKCSYRNREDAYFCVNCGAKLRNKNNVWMIVAIIVAIVLSAILLINLYSSDDNNGMQTDMLAKSSNTNNEIVYWQNQEYVDLGLPSGTLWATENAGGDGVYYTYAEAVSKFGNNLPTKEQFEELHEKCTIQLTSSGYRIVGPNKNSIYLPLEGSRQGYWYNKSNKGNMHGLFFSSGVNELGRNYGFSVRLVKD